MATKPKKLASAKAPEIAEPVEAMLERLTQQIEVRLSEFKSTTPVTSRRKLERTPGRFKGALAVGPEFFEPFTDDELKDFTPQ